MATSNHLSWYATILGDWQTKICGPKPTADQFKVVHGWGFRPGVEALHLAMCLRKEGCTVRQFCVAGSCGPANNKRGLVVKRGLATVTVTGKPYAFTLTPTAKGLALVKANEAKAQAADEKAATKAKKADGKNGKAKTKKATPRKPKAPKPTVDQPTPPAPTTDQPSGDQPQS